VTRLLDRMLGRASYDNMTEYSGSGAYLVTTSDPSGRQKEGAPPGTVRSAREGPRGQRGWSSPASRPGPRYLAKRAFNSSPPLTNICSDCRR